MHRHVGRDLFAQRHYAQVLHDERVDAEGRRHADQIRRALHLAVEHERIERQMDLDAAHMTVDNGLLQIGGRKIAGVHTRVEGIGA